MQQIVVLSKKEMFKQAECIAVPHIIISINNLHAETAQFPPNPHRKFVLSVAFNDAPSNSIDSMTISDARIIWTVANMYKNKAIIFIHCEGGVSRSAAIGAAISWIWFKDDDFIFKDCRYSPNMFCHKLMFLAANEEYDDDMWKVKEEKQYELWKKDMFDRGVLAYKV